MKKKFLIITTIPVSLYFFKGQVGKLKTVFDVEVVSSHGQGFDDFCQGEKVKGNIVKMEREISLFNDIKSLFKLIKLFRKTKPTIIHGNTPKAGFLSMIAGWITRVPNRIYCIHGLRYQGAIGFKRKLLKSMERISCKFATEVMTVSFGVKAILKEENICNKEVKIIWNGSVNGIDTNRFSPSNIDGSDLESKYKFTDEHIIFGFVGRLVKDKGINELIEAFKEVNKKYTNTRLLLVGNYESSDPVSDHTKKEIEDNTNIIFGGWQRDIRPFLKIMDIFTFPSYREGFGLSLMEAAAMNVPAISSNITGCNEIIKDGYNGMLIPSKSVTELINAMSKVAENPQSIKKMSSVSRQYVIDKYEQKQLWEKVLEMYKNIAK